jgi:tetratricopeptide (TPR) repeat protein
MERRFKQELVLARQVTHKNVVRIHDLGEIDGIKYITMPYLEGSDLATVLKERGKMPVPEALGIIRDVAAGLSAAHEAGIVHRDLKPANIMVLKDHAVIMDFGIARSSKLAAEAANAVAPAETLDSMKSAVASTMVGTILGTVQYMAPEQAKAQPVDQRADIYALGLIFLDMLLGKRHTHAASAIEELKSRIEQPPPLAQTIDPTIPKPVEQVIAKCLQPDREQRYTTSADLVAALDRLDEKGELIPIKRVVRLPYAIAAAVLLTAASVGVWWYQRQFIPPAQHDPVSVVIADFVNNTRDQAFDRALESMARLALEEAGFISAYDRTQLRRNIGVRPPEVLDSEAARKLAIQQGLGVVVSGSLERQGEDYALTMTAAEAVTGKVIVTVDDDVANKGQVLGMATRLAGEVREALGGEPSDSAQRFAMETLSSSSLDVVRSYALAIEATSDGNFDRARQNFAEALKLDQNFGLAYAGMAMMLRNLGQHQEAEKYASQSITHLEGMTERESHRTRGIYYTITGDYQACVKEYGELIARYASDAAAHSNRALCSTYLRDLGGAVNEMRRVTEILPRRALSRVNLALYAAYGSDFKTSDEEARKAVELGSSLGLLPLAFSQILQGQPAEAAATYGKLKAASALGASFAASGLGDLAVYEGRFRDADRILQDGAQADVAAKDSDRAAAKLVSLAHARLASGQRASAVAAARRALELSPTMKIEFLAARILVEADEIAEARKYAKALASEVRAEPQAYAKIIEGELLTKQRDYAAAIKILSEANEEFDTWLGHFALGRAYLAAGKGFLVQADSEFSRCLEHRGEALSVFLDEEPTYGYFPDVYYYRGLVREAAQIAGFAESYRAYLAVREKAGEDPRLKEIRKKIQGTP